MRMLLLAVLMWLALPPPPATAHVAVKDDHLRALVMDVRERMQQHLPAGQWRAAKRLWDAESHWNPRSGSPSECFGIPQSCPGTKMRSALRPDRGPKWDSIRDPWVQWLWGTTYVHQRYGTFKKALKHQEATGWY
jgi:hypothetical protein